MTDIEVRYIEVDLPPIQIGLIVHVVPDHAGCMAGAINSLGWNGEAYVTEFLPPGRNRPYSDRPYRFEPGGQTLGTYHRLAECPQLHASTGAAVNGLTMRT